MQRVRGRWDQGDNRRHGQMGFVDHVRGLAAHLVSRDAEEEIVSLEDHFSRSVQVTQRGRGETRWRPGHSRGW